MRRVGAALEQQRRHVRVSPTGGVQERGRAIAVDRVYRQSEFEQFANGFGIAGRRRRDHVDRAQWSAWQFPARPIQPALQVRLSTRQGQTQWRFVIGGAHFRIGARTQQRLDQCFACGLRCGQRGKQRRAPVPVAHPHIGASRQQRIAQPRPSVRQRQGQGRASLAVGAKCLCPAFQHAQCERFQLGLRDFSVHRGHANFRHRVAAGRLCAGIDEISRCRQHGWQLQQGMLQQRRAVEAGVRIEPVIEQPAARRRVRMRGQFAIKPRQRLLRPCADVAGASLHDLPMAEPQRVEQVPCRIVGGVGGLVCLQMRRPWIFGIDQGDDVPAPCGGGEIHRASSILGGKLTRNAEPEQALHGFLARAQRLRGDGKRAAPGMIDRVRRRPQCDQDIENGMCIGACRLHQRGGTVGVRGVDASTGIQQDLRDRRMTVQCCGHQGGALQGAACVHSRLAFEQQFHAFRVVVVDRCRGDQSRLRRPDFGFGALFEQKARQFPIRCCAGQDERRFPGAVDRVELGASVAQQRGNDWFCRKGGKMQRRIAIGIRAIHVGAVGQQGHHRLGASFAAVAGRSDQHRQPGMHALQIRAFCDEAAQQSNIRIECGQDQCAALVAVIGRRRTVRIRAMFQRGQRELGLAGAHAAQQHGIQIAGAKIRKHLFGWRRRAFLGR